MAVVLRFLPQAQQKQALAGGPEQERGARARCVHHLVRKVACWTEEGGIASGQRQPEPGQPDPSPPEAQTGLRRVQVVIAEGLAGATAPIEPPASELARLRAAGHAVV